MDAHAAGRDEVYILDVRGPRARACGAVTQLLDPDNGPSREAGEQRDKPQRRSVLMDAHAAGRDEVYILDVRGSALSSILIRFTLTSLAERSCDRCCALLP